MESVSVKTERAEVCALCLSRGRTFVAPPPSFRMLIGCNVQHTVEAEWSVCWECSAVLWKMQRLRIRAMHAQRWLTDTQLHSEVSIKDKGSLSSLKCTLKTTYDMEICHQDFPRMEVDLKKDSPKHNVWSDDESYFETTHDEFLEDKKDIEIKLEAVDAEIESVAIKTEKCKAKRRSKAKFKVLKNLVEDNNSAKKKKLSQLNIFKIIPMTEEEMQKLRESDRNAPVFSKSPHRCDTCIMKFMNSNIHKQHMKKCHSKETGRHRCGVCETRFPSAAALSRHVARHYERYQCNMCALTARRMQTVYRHYIFQHSRDVQFQCEECGGIFRTQNELSEHRQELHTCFVCDICGQKFLSRRTIEKHMRSRHVPFSCRDCGLVVKSRTTLAQHRFRLHATHAPSADAYCVECDKQFRHHLAYKDHVAVVHGNKPQFTCPECGKHFTRGIYMRNHQDLIHRNQSKHQCQKCNKPCKYRPCHGPAITEGFLRPDGLRRHTQTVHERRPMPKTKVCEVCGRAFQTNRILANHRRTHTGERPFACEYCSAAFAQKTALCSHVKHIHLHAARNK